MDQSRDRERKARLGVVELLGCGFDRMHTGQYTLKPAKHSIRLMESLRANVHVHSRSQEDPNTRTRTDLVGTVLHEGLGVAGENVEGVGGRVGDNDVVVFGLAALLLLADAVVVRAALLDDHHWW